MNFNQTDAKISITIPPPLDVIDTIVKLRVDRPVMEIPAVDSVDERIDGLM